MKIIKDNKTTKVVIPYSEVEWIRFLLDKPKTISEWEKSTGADIVINGAFFSNGKPIETFKTNNKIVSLSDWCRKGIGITNYRLKLEDINDTHYDFICGFPVLYENGKSAINLKLPEEIGANNLRSVLGFNKDEVILGTTEMTIAELANYKFADNAINLDGGGSSRLHINGQVINSPSKNREVPQVVAIKLKKDVKSITEIKPKNKICLDYGHNNSGWDTGASYYGHKEQDLTFSIGKLVKQGLEPYFEIIETRPTKTTILGTNLNTSLSSRSEIANKSKADYFISIHCNANSNVSAHGTETYIQARGGKAEQLALKVNNALVKEIGTFNRGVKVNNLAVTRQTNMPAILIEVAFLSNRNDCNILINRQQDIANGIVKGVLEFMGFVYEYKVNKYSYDDTVNALIEKGITDIANMGYWEKCLDGREPLSKENVRIIFDRLIDKIKG